MSGFEAVEQAQALIRQVRACWPTMAKIGSGFSDENAVLEKLRQWCGMTGTYHWQGHFEAASEHVNMICFPLAATGTQEERKKVRACACFLKPLDTFTSTSSIDTTSMMRRFWN